jgi:hypothetical protein
LIPVMCGIVRQRGIWSERISPRLPWGKRINAFGPKISEQHANCTPYPIRRQYKTRCTLAEHCRPLAANLLYARGAAGKA